MNTSRTITVVLFFLAGMQALADEKADQQSSPLHILFRGEAETELAPHGEGNVYAPEVMKYRDKYLMWYGGQGKDGHDRIHLAESTDGVTWKKLGVVLDNSKANHVNDPSVVRANNVFYMYYTQADEREFDQIHVATSADGIHWIPDGIAIPRGNPGDWDAKVVGRPSAFYDKETETFHLYYDGRNEGERSVGHAISDDGIIWTKSPTTPLFGHNAGGIDVHRVGKNFVMLYESREGTFLATSHDGLTWQDHGLWIPISKTPADTFGQVTPFLLLDDKGEPTDVYFGAAGRTTWDGNTIGVIKIDEKVRKTLNQVIIGD